MAAFLMFEHCISEMRRIRASFYVTWSKDDQAEFDSVKANAIGFASI